MIPTNGYFIGGPESVNILGVRGVLCMWQLVFASRHRLIPQQEEEHHAKRVPDGHGRSFGSWPWQKNQVPVLKVAQAAVSKQQELHNYGILRSMTCACSDFELRTL